MSEYSHLQRNYFTYCYGSKPKLTGLFILNYYKKPSGYKGRSKRQILRQRNRDISRLERQEKLKYDRKLAKNNTVFGKLWKTIKFSNPITIGNGDVFSVKYTFESDYVKTQPKIAENSTGETLFKESASGNDDICTRNGPGS